jgi:hypothetical protein
VAVYLLTLCLAVGRASAHGRPVMEFSTYQPRIWNQYHLTNRALRNRCLPAVGIADFTRYPLRDASAWWRDERVRWAHRKHERAQKRAPGLYCRALGKRMAAEYGWTGYEWTALDAIVRRESNWNPCRHFPSTTNCSYAGPSACAIPQAYPCSKLLAFCGTATIGACPPRRQIRWLLQYVDGRYGSPSVALANGDTY